MAAWPKSKSFLIKKFRSTVGFLPRTWSSLGIWESFGSHAWTVVLPVFLAKAREMEKLTFWKMETFLKMRSFSPVSLNSMWIHLGVEFLSFVFWENVKIFILHTMSWLCDILIGFFFHFFWKSISSCSCYLDIKSGRKIISLCSLYYEYRHLVWPKDTPV